MLLLTCNERVVFEQMSNSKSVINASSTKSDIIDAASELISIQEDDINSKAKLLLNIQEEKQALTYLLVATSIYGLLF